MNKKDNSLENGSSKGLMLNCREATLLMVIAEQEPLSFKQTIALKFHLMLCKVCKIFKTQSIEINVFLKQNALRAIELDESKKANIKAAIHQLSSEQ